MLKGINLSSREINLIVYTILAAATLCVFWQVSQFDFINLDDPVYILNNYRIQSGLTLESIRWAFNTTYAEFWHPLTWLSLMLDYQLFGLNAGGYHMTNLVLHIFNTLLLFWLFNRMTHAVWKSAFVAAFFALHPLHVESVVWIAERKDVLSAFFYMMTLCLYVYYTEKPMAWRYLSALFAFALALMSKSIVVTLPVIMILFDYWPLKRFELKRENLFFWELKEKAPFFIFSALFSLITVFEQPSVRHFPLHDRIVNAVVSVVVYLRKAFWPDDLAIFYPFPASIPVWHVIGASLIIILLTLVVLILVRHRPYLFVGWSFYFVTLLPVLGIVQVGNHALADRYAYLSLIGVSIMLAWGIPLLFDKKERLGIILMSSGVLFFILLGILTWKQCSYWKNDKAIFNRALMVTKNNYLAHFGLGMALDKEGKNDEAVYHCNMAIRIKSNFASGYNCRGAVYYRLGNYDQALENCKIAINLQPDHAESYYYEGLTYHRLNRFDLAVESFNKALSLQPDRADFYTARGKIYAEQRQYKNAIMDYNQAITLKPDYADAYNGRGSLFINNGMQDIGCRDLKKACVYRDCNVLEAAKTKGFCR